jgi:hypothetical protein
MIPRPTGLPCRLPRVRLGGTARVFPAPVLVRACRICYLVVPQSLTLRCSRHAAPGCSGRAEFRRRRMRLNFGVRRRGH